MPSMSLTATHSRPGARTLPPMTEVRHPLFARLYARVVSRVMERELGDERRVTLAGLSGRVVEVGAGNGMNFRHYPATVDEVVAVEPEPYLRAAAVEAARDTAVDVSVVDGVADAIPLEDASCDAGVACLVLCSVPDQAAALAELRRVLVPGAELRFLEHVRSDGAAKARIQRGADRSGVWPRIAGGCHCSRDTASALTAAGFEVEELQAFDLGPGWGLTNPHIRGVARSAT